MDYPNQPDAPGGRYIDSGANGAEGTVLRAAALNALNDEIIGLIEASGQTPDSADVGQLLRAVGLIGGGKGGAFKNWIINGGFDVWQRGSQFIGITDSTYTADRWEVQGEQGGGTGSARVTRTLQANDGGANEGIFAFMRYRQNATPDGLSAIRTKLEVLPELAGKRCTFSFLMRSSTASKQVTVLTSTHFNQSSVDVSADQFNATEGWTRYSFTFDVPDLLGVTFLDGFPHYLQLEILPPKDLVGVTDLAQCQLEEGGVPTEFELRPQNIEEFLCRRYFQSSFDFDEVVPLSSQNRIAVRTNSDPVPFLSVRLYPTMRAAPTTTYFDEDEPGRIDWPGTSGEVAGVQTALQSQVAITPPTMTGGPPSSVTLAKFNFTCDAEI